MNLFKADLSRREMLKVFGRLGAFGALSYLAARLFRKSSLRAGEVCVGDFICRRCASVGNCGLPQALSYRRAKGSGSP